MAEQETAKTTDSLEPKKPANSAIPKISHVNLDEEAFDPNNCIDISFTSKVITTKPVPGEAILNASAIEASKLTSRKGRWINVDYDERREVMFHELSEAEVHKDTGEETKFIGVTQSGPIKVSVYRHKIPPMYIQKTSGNVFWEAFDIPFVPNWKELVAEKLKGLTSANVAIVRLLSQYGAGSYYVTMYIRNTSISDYINGEWMKIRKAPAHERKSIYEISLDYNNALLQDPNYGHFVSALAYASYLCEGKPFHIAEQIQDYRYNGNTRLLMTGSGPRTEIRKEYNIFATKAPRYVYTNYGFPLYVCSYSQDTYSIKKLWRIGGYV